MDSYLRAMDELSLAIGRMSGQFEHAEGWRRHSHLGFCDPQSDPLQEALKSACALNPKYEAGLNIGLRVED